MHDKNKVAWIFKIFVLLFSRECDCFFTISNLLCLLGIMSEFGLLGAKIGDARLWEQK